MARQATVLKMFLHQKPHAVATQYRHLTIEEVAVAVDRESDPDPEEWIDSPFWEEWEGFWDWWGD